MTTDLIKFTTQNEENYIIFKFEGEFTNDNAAWIFEQAKKILIEKSAKNVIFNMGQIEYINSRAAGGIADIYETIEDYSGKVYITNMNEFVKDSLELLGMFLFINHTETEEKAINELKN